MEIKFWGTRGSIPSPGPQTLEFGGNTTCLEVVLASGRRLIIDAGTGIRPLGDHLQTHVASVRLHLLLTHNHWDHLMGLPFFAPIYREDTEIMVDGWPLAFQALRRVFDDHKGDGFFPVAWDELQSRRTFINRLARGPLTLDEVRIDTIPLNHPQGSLGYRFREGDHTLVFFTDHELGMEKWHRFEDFVQFVRGCDLLIHDAQYLPEEIEEHRGWGHSSFEEALRLAVEAEVKHLVLTHHDPSRSDAQVRDIVKRARKQAAAHKSTLRIDAAREHDIFHLPELVPVKNRRPAPSAGSRGQ